MADLLDDLSWRGLIASTTDLQAMRSALEAGALTLYCGFDPTAASLHIGNLVPLLVLRRFQLAGHRPIVVSGGATGLIGDPSGRSTERVLHSAETVAGYLDRIRGQLAQFLRFDASPTGALMVDNLEWTAQLSAIDFLRDVGKHFSVNAMLAKETVRSRLAGAGLSYTEFSYPLLQSLDFLELFRRHDCRLQIGGNDQWGNLTAGLDLIRRVTGSTAHAMTVPLVTSATGEKFGKSTGGGSLWLDPALTSPYAFYQYWVNVDDRDVGPYLRYFTFLPRPQIEALETATAREPAARAAQRRLAEELTTLVHGAEECRRVQAASAALFGRGSLSDVPAETLESALAEVPRLTVPPGRPATIVDLLAGTGLCASRSEARRAVSGGGAYVNNAKVADADAVPSPADLLAGRWLVLRRGRRSVAGVEYGS